MSNELISKLRKLQNDFINDSMLYGTEKSRKSSIVPMRSTKKQAKKPITKKKTPKYEENIIDDDEIVFTTRRNNKPVQIKPQIVFKSDKSEKKNQLSSRQIESQFQIFMRSKQFEDRKAAISLNKFFRLWKSRIINSILRKANQKKKNSKNTLKFSSVQNSISIEKKKKTGRPGLFDKELKKNKKTNLVTEEVQATPTDDDSSEDDDLLVRYTHELIAESKKITKNRQYQSSDSDYDFEKLEQPPIPKLSPPKPAPLPPTTVKQKPLNPDSDDSIDELITNVKELVQRKPTKVEVPIPNDDYEDDYNLEEDLKLRSVLEAARLRQGTKMARHTEFDDKDSDDVDKELTERHVSRLISPKQPIPRYEDSDQEIEQEVASIKRSKKQKETKIIYNSSDIEKEVTEIQSKRTHSFSASPSSSPHKDSPRKQIESPVTQNSLKLESPSRISSPIMPIPAQNQALKVDLGFDMSSEEGEEIHKYLEDENDASSNSFDEEAKIGAYLKMKRKEFQNEFENDEFMKTTKLSSPKNEVKFTPSKTSPKIMITSPKNEVKFTPSKFSESSPKTVMSPPKDILNIEHGVYISPMKPGRMNIIGQNSPKISILDDDDDKLLEKYSFNEHNAFESGSDSDAYIMKKQRKSSLIDNDDYTNANIMKKQTKFSSIDNSVDTNAYIMKNQSKNSPTYNEYDTNASIMKKQPMSSSIDNYDDSNRYIMKKQAKSSLVDNYDDSEKEILNIIAESKARPSVLKPVEKKSVGWSTESDDEDSQFPYSPQKLNESDEKPKVEAKSPPKIIRNDSDSDDIDDFVVENSKWNENAEIKTSSPIEKKISPEQRLAQIKDLLESVGEEEVSVSSLDVDVKYNELMDLDITDSDLDKSDLEE